jgi:hypothetical protein
VVGEVLIETELFTFEIRIISLVRSGKSVRGSCIVFRHRFKQIKIIGKIPIQYIKAVA